MANAARRTLVAPALLTGFASARHPSALTEGLASILYDFRLDDGTLRVRWGSLLVNPLIASASAFRGAIETRFGGTPSLFAAMAANGKVSILASTDEGASFAALPTTDPGGAEARLSDLGPVFFAVVGYQSKDYLVVQNGADSPRYWDGAAMRVVPTLDASPYTLSVSMDLGTGSVLAGNPAVSVTNAGDFDAQVRTLGVGSYYLWLHADPGHINNANEYVVVGPLNDPFTLPALPTSGPTPQIATFFDAGAAASTTTDANKLNTSATYGTATPDERWRAMLIEGSADGQTWFTLYDPASTPVVAVQGAGTTYLAAWPITAANAGKTVNRLRFSYPIHYGNTKDADVFLRLYRIGNAGTLPGGTAYGAAFGEPGQTLAGDGQIRSGGRIAPASSVTPPAYGGVSVPVSDLVLYTYRLRVASTTPGVQVPVYIYRNDLGTSGYYYLDSFLGPGSYLDAGAKTVDFTRPLPDALALPIPKGTSMATVNNRLLVCAADRFWYSADSNPFAFSRLVLTDDQGQPIPTSAGSFGKPGETFTSVVATGQVPTGAESDGTPQTGAVTTYVQTDRTTYVLSGWDALSLNKSTPIGIGTRSPFSVARRQSGGFYFLDSQLQVRTVQGTTMAPISKHLVDDQLRGIPAARVVWASGLSVADRLYLAFTPAGGAANTLALVYNDTLGWESIDRPALAMQRLTGVYSASMGRTRILAFSDSIVSEHAVPGLATDVGGSKVAARAIFAEQSAPGDQQGRHDLALLVGAFFVVADTDAGGTATISLQCSTGNLSAGTIPVGSLSLSAKVAGDLRATRRTEPAPAGSETLTVVPTLDVLASGGTRVLRLDMEASAGVSLSSM